MEELILPFKDMYKAVMAGQSWLAAAIALVILVTAVRKYGPKRFAFLKSDVGGVCLSFGLSIAGALVSAFAAGAAPSFGMLSAAFGVAFAASGGYSALRKVVMPILEMLRAKLPAWASPIIDLVGWAFSKNDAIKEAEAKGQAAVDAAPSKGIIGFVGNPTEPGDNEK